MDTQKTPERDPPGQARFVPVRKSAGDQVMSRLVNPVVRRVLRSPLHDLISGSTLLLGVRGRRTGIWREVAGNYHADGDVLTMVSQPRRSWWRNLDGGKSVRVVLRGVERTGIGAAEAGEGSVKVRITLDPMPEVPRARRGRQLWWTWFKATTLGVPTVGQLWDVSEPLAVGLAAAGAAVLLSSIGLLQWRVLRRHVARAGRWVPATAGAWIAGLLGFTAVTSPLWRAGQPAVLVAAIGVLGAVVMAATVAAITGLALVRLLPPPIGQED